MLQHSLEGSGIESLDTGAIATTWLNLGETGVAIFFLVSGFIIPASAQSTPTPRDFWVRRALRIYPLYWFVFAITLALSVTLLGRPLPAAVPTLLTHVVFVQEWVGANNYVGGSWTLFIELIWYVLFATAYFSKIAIERRLVWLSLVAYATAIAIGPFLFHHFPLGRVSLLALCCFGYSYLLRLEDRIGAREFSAIAVLFILSIAAALFIGFHLHPSGRSGEPSFSCVTVSWSLALLSFAFLFRYRNSRLAHSPMLRWLGEISYSVYLLHAPTMLILKHFHVPGFSFVLLNFAITISVSTLTFRYVERPGVALARRLTHRRVRSVPAEVAIVGDPATGG